MVEENLNEVNEKLQAEHQEKERISTEKIWKIFAIVFLIFTVITLIIIKTNNKDFPLWLIIVIFVIVAIVCAGMYFAFSMFKNFGEDEKVEKARNGLPKAISLNDLRKIASQALTNSFYANHTKKLEEEQQFHVGRNKERIYCVKSKLLYTDGYEEGWCYIIINAHFPEDLRTVLIDPPQAKLIKAIQSIASIPDDDPNTEETRIENALTGTSITTRKSEKALENKKLEDKKKEDL